MKPLSINLPDWCPAWMTKHAEGKPATWGSALLHGLLFPILVFLLLVKKVRVGAVVVLGGACYLLYFQILDYQQQLLFEIFSRISFGLVAWVWIWRGVSDVHTAKRSLFASLSALVTIIVVQWLAILWFLSIAFVLARGIFRGIEAKGESELEKQRQGLLSKEVVIRPWALCWCVVKNDNQEEDSWAKVRPCVLLPPPPYPDGRLTFDPADYYRFPEDGLYYVLICTSQLKRADDDRYLEIHPFHRLKNPDRFSRTFVYLGERFVMSAPEPGYNEEDQVQALAQGRLPRHHVVFQKHIALLSENDIRAIVAHMPKIDFEAERMRRIRNWQQDTGGFGPQNP